MEKHKPKITDPEEFALIKSIYFGKDDFNKEKIDPIEQWERMESRQKNINNNSR